MVTLPTTQARSTTREVRARRIITVLLLGASLLLAAPCAWSLDLDTILENTAVTPPNRVGFREERHDPILKEPMVLTGHLEYLSAGVLRKVIETPFEEAFLVESDRIIIERNGETHSLAVKRSRSLRTILDAIEAILSGESEKLESVFNYELSGTHDAWSVQLTPISRRIARQLTAMQVNGDDQSVTSIRINLEGGEWHIMDILRNDIEQ